MLLQAMVAAQAKTGSISSEAYRAEVGRIVSSEIAKMPFAVVDNDSKGAKSSAPTSPPESSAGSRLLRTANPV